MFLFAILHASTHMIQAQLTNEDKISQSFNYDVVIDQAQNELDFWKQKVDEINKLPPNSMYHMEFDMERICNEYLLLLKQCQKAQKFEQNDKGWTLLMYTSYLGQNDTVQCLLNAGAEVNVQNKQGKTALFFASQGLPIAFVRSGGSLAFGSGADWNAPENDKNETKIINLLLKAGADVNIKDNNGNTVLMWVSSPYTRVFKLLLDAGVDINAKNNVGKTVLDMIKNSEFIQLLNEAGVITNE